MKKALSIACIFLLAACAGAPSSVVPKQEPVWRYAVRTAADGSRKAFAVDMNSADEIPLPDGLWCPHGALIELQRDGKGKVVGAKSKPEPVVYDGVGWASDELTGMPGLRPGLDWIPSFALAPAPGQKQPWVVVRWGKEGPMNWAILERRPDRLRVTRMGPWQIEHLQFQRMERPGPGLENAVLLTFQAGEGSQHAVLKVEIGENGARLRPMTAGDAAMIKGFMGRAMEGEKGVLGRVVGE